MKFWSPCCIEMIDQISTGHGLYYTFRCIKKINGPLDYHEGILRYSENLWSGFLESVAEQVCTSE